MRPAPLLAVLALGLATAACGSDDNASPDTTTRTIRVEMVDIAYTPTALQVKIGEIINFEFTNNGKVAHDAFVGDDAAQLDHEKAMSGGGMGHDSHEEGGDAITVEPGKSGELEHTFDTAGTFQIGCHQPGHYAAGMRIAVTVS